MYSPLSISNSRFDTTYLYFFKRNETSFLFFVGYFILRVSYHFNLSDSYFLPIHHLVIIILIDILFLKSLEYNNSNKTVDSVDNSFNTDLSIYY